MPISLFSRFSRSPVLYSWSSSQREYRILLYISPRISFCTSTIIFADTRLTAAEAAMLPAAIAAIVPAIPASRAGSWLSTISIRLRDATDTPSPIPAPAIPITMYISTQSLYFFIYRYIQRSSPDTSSRYPARNFLAAFFMKCFIFSLIPLLYDFFIFI